MAHGLLEWLTDAERVLRYQGPLPLDSEEKLTKLLAEHQVCCISTLPCYHVIDFIIMGLASVLSFSDVIGRNLTKKDNLTKKRNLTKN